MQTKPNILSPVAHSTRNSTNESDLVELITSINRRMGSLGSTVAKNIFPPHTSRLQQLRQERLDAPLFGSPDNYSFSTIQVNISPLSTTNLSSLGYSGRSHPHRHDDPMSLTLLVCISKIVDTTDPGKFTSAKHASGLLYIRSLF